MNVLVHPMMSIFQIFYLMKLLKRQSIKKDPSYVTQEEANLAFEGQQLLLYEKYSFVLRTLWFCGFYGALVPIIFSVSFLGLILSYWVERVMINNL
jgi:hypothetical protein